MCGILSYYQKNPLNLTTLNQSLKSLQSIKHRGPDGEGVLLLNTYNGNYQYLNTKDTPNGIEYGIDINQLNIQDYNMILGHRRLSIIDLSVSGHQPLIDQDSKCIIVFNGEIYNYIELKEELIQLGHDFKTNTDTEVITKAYKQWGTNCLNKFNGMWSFVLFDINEKSLFISRDRFGIKPMNYHVFSDSSWVIFSEEKQLFEFNQYHKDINHYRVAQLMDNQITGTVENDTFYKDIFQLSKSCFIKNKIESFNFNNPQNYYKVETENFLYHYNAKEKAINEFNKKFNHALLLTLRSDVPVGLGFSGGIDSSRIVYECYQHFQKPDTFSAVFPSKKEDESKYIEIVKNHLELKSNYCYPEKEYNKDEFKKLTFHLDAPVPSSSYFAEWCVSKLVKSKNIKVLLVGQGADEVYAGYHHHAYRYFRSLIFRGKWNTFKKEMKAYCQLKSVETKFLNQLIWAEIKLVIKIKLLGKKDMNSKWYSSFSLSNFLKDELLFFQIPFYLRANDRIGMAFNFESRYPFLDHQLVNFGFQCADDLKINNGWQKWIIRESNTHAPDSIKWRKDKVGYVMPQFEISDEENEKNKEILMNKFGKYSNDKFLNYSICEWLKINF